jgi:hypothetical protein
VREENNTMAKEQVLSVSEAMREAGVFSQQVYAAISGGRLKAVRNSGRWQISQTSFNEWKKRLETRRGLAASEPCRQIAHVTT